MTSPYFSIQIARRGDLNHPIRTSLLARELLNPPCASACTGSVCVFVCYREIWSILPGNKVSKVLYGVFKVFVVWRFASFKSYGVICWLPLLFLLDKLPMDKRDSDGFFLTKLVCGYSNSSMAWLTCHWPYWNSSYPHELLSMYLLTWLFLAHWYSYLIM